MSTIAEFAPSTEVTGKRLVEVVSAIGRDGLRRLLRLVAYPCQIMIEQPGNEFIAEDGLDGRIADGEFTPPVVRRPIHGTCDDFGLVNRGDWLRMVRYPRANP